MNLKIKRTQKMGGIINKKPIFGIDFRAEYTEEERASINNYNLGGETILELDALTVTIKSIQTGHYIECPDLPTLLKKEQAIHDTCEGLKRYLEVAKTFNGQEVLFEF